MGICTVKVGALEYLTADGIGAPHCFTTRLGGVSTGAVGSLNLGWNRGDRPENVTRNFQILADALGFDTESLVLTQQTHSDIVRRVSRQDARGLNNRVYPECDGLITNDPGTALTVFSADCTPVLLWDPVTGAVGAAHAGWRGTRAKIAQKAVLAMAEAYGCRPGDIRAAIGPNIGQCCFETDADVPQAMVEAFGGEAEKHILKRDEKYYVNLKRLNELALRQVGVERIEIARECTACQSSRFWSHRVTGSVRGSQGAIIVCREVTV